MELLNNFQIESFRKDLISWFDENKRDLPWRKDKNAYKVWVSEIMLQQTRVDTVIPYFNRFLEQFPTIRALASAEEEKVLKAWEGLGYYSRARNLQAGARQVVTEFGGIVPNTSEEISRIKGVGPYTSGAILSIAYGIPEPAVDGNVMRVCSRLLLIWEDIAKAKTRSIFEEAIRKVIEPKNPSFFNQGLMELGALICSPQSPKCSICPVQSHCRAFAQGIQKELPVKSKKKQPKPLEIAVSVLRNKEGKFLVRKRPSSGLLADLWEFPNGEFQEGENAEFFLKKYISSSFKVPVEISSHMMNLEHVFSHIKWNMSVFEGVILDKIEETESLRFLSLDELEALPFPVSHQKILSQAKKQFS